ncbi:SEC-C metal-binding domain-containing protein [Winogradskyella maritima]|uniref:DUF5677 domain-containing protein n=1 Tax=Winogradskyella maritima TaxID=1517766 RepID=A0ABV8AMH7_9FLAO|nr:SEC-C metal-binding domain-containing protein [Winogradskyella maritima]
MKIGRNEKCPCGSGKKYKSCCINNDDIVSIPITKEIREILDRENERFKSIMGRDITGDDPLIPSTIQVSEEVYIENSVLMLEEVGIRPEIIYAFKKLGYCVGESQLHLYSKEQLQDWEEAVDEYFLIESGEIEISESKLSIILSELYDLFDKLKYVYALIIAKHSNEDEQIVLMGNLNIDHYILFCLTKNLKTIEAIGVLLDNHFGEDSLNLTRTNYENYLEILYAKYNSKSLKEYVIAKEGIFNNTHIYKRGHIVDKKTEEKFKSLNNYEKSKLNTKYESIDIEIYKYLYDHLSSFTHLDLRTAGNYIVDRRGFSHLARNMLPDTVIILLVINVMILEEIKVLSIFKTSKKDVEKLVTELGSCLLKLFKEDKVNIHFSINDRIHEIMKTYS